MGIPPKCYFLRFRLFMSVSVHFIAENRRNIDSVFAKHNTRHSVYTRKTQNASFDIPELLFCNFYYCGGNKNKNLLILFYITM
jgi:hypothetical protein